MLPESVLLGCAGGAGPSQWLGACRGAHRCPPGPQCPDSWSAPGRGWGVLRLRLRVLSRAPRPWGPGAKSGIDTGLQGSAVPVPLGEGLSLPAPGFRHVQGTSSVFAARGPRGQDPGHASEAPRIVPGTRRALHKCLWLRSLSSVPWVCWEVDKRPQRCLNLNPQTREMRQVMRRGGIRLQRESGLLVSWSRHEGESWIIQRHHGVLLKGRRRQRGRERGVTAEAGAERASVAGLADGGRAESQGMRVASGSWGRPGEELPPGPPRGARPARLPISAPGGPSRPPETHSCEMTDSC